MKKLLMGSIVLTTFAASVIIFQISCKKEATAQANTSAGATDQAEARICDVKGVYLQQSKDHNGNTGSAYYTLGENNFVVGGFTLEGPNDTFGGYSNTCDSISMSVYYTVNQSYYLLKGKFGKSKTVIKGTFQNLTQTSDYGTFIMTKQ